MLTPDELAAIFGPQTTKHLPVMKIANMNSLLILDTQKRVIPIMMANAVGIHNSIDKFGQLVHR